MTRRGTAWYGKTFAYQALTTGISSIDLVSDTLLHGTAESPTVIRMLGRLWFGFERSDGGFQESQRSDLFLGISCVKPTLPNLSPRDNVSDEDWMWIGFMRAESTFIEETSRQFDANTVIGGTTESRATQHIPSTLEEVSFDVRSMRKAPQPCEVRLSLQLTEQLAQTGASHKLSGFIRILVKT